MQPPGLIMFDHYSNVLCPPASAKTAPWKGWSTPQPTISIPFLRLHEACRLIHVLSVLADSSTLPKTRIAIQWPFHAGNLVESKNYHLFSNKTQWIYGGTKKSLHLEAQLDNQGSSAVLLLALRSSQQLNALSFCARPDGYRKIGSPR